MTTNMTSTLGSVADKSSADQPKTKRLPPLVLPNSPPDGNEFHNRLKYFAATSQAFKWDHKTITTKTKKYLPRNGFHMLVWSAILIDTENVMPLIGDIFGDNIVRISDEQFETTFGVPVDTSADIPVDQLLTNYFLFFALPAKSHNQYLEEWIRKRVDAFAAMIRRFDSKLSFACHPELFVATKRRYYVYKSLVPALTRHIIDTADNRPVFHAMKRQIFLAMSYSGLQWFRQSFTYSQNPYTEAVDLEAVKEDIKRITSAREAIVEKYGEKYVPFARLLGFPEADQLDRRHYPDLALCAYHHMAEEAKHGGRTSLTNLSFRKLETKTAPQELAAKANVSTYKPGNFAIPDLTDEEKSILLSLGIPSNFTTFVNPYEHLDLYDDFMLDD